MAVTLATTITAVFIQQRGAYYLFRPIYYQQTPVLNYSLLAQKFSLRILYLWEQHVVQIVVMFLLVACLRGTLLIATCGEQIMNVPHFVPHSRPRVLFRTKTTTFSQLFIPPSLTDNSFACINYNLIKAICIVKQKVATTMNIPLKLAFHFVPFKETLVARSGTLFWERVLPLKTVWLVTTFNLLAQRFHDASEFWTTFE